MHADRAYEELIRRVREESLLVAVEALLEWDEETYMPPGGVHNRSEQLALLAGLVHDRGTDPRIGELLGEVEGSSVVADPASAAAINVRELRREHDRYSRLPRTLVEDVARTTALAQQAWAEARAAAEFAGFRPWLERIVELKRAEAECVGYAREPYDALLEDYEPELRSDVVARLYAALRRELVPLAARLASAPPRPDPAAPPPRSVRAPPGCCGRSPAEVRGDGRGRGRFRLPAGAHGSWRSPLLHRGGRGRLPDRGALRAARLRRRAADHPPRGRARPLRAGARPQALRQPSR